MQYRSFRGRTSVNGSGSDRRSDRAAARAPVSHDAREEAARPEFMQLMRDLGLGGHPAWFDDVGDAATGLAQFIP